MGRYTTLTADIEHDLVCYILESEKRLFGITLEDARCMAYQLATRNNIKHCFDNTTTKRAGKRWIDLFRKRHPEITLRTPEATSGILLKCICIYIYIYNCR